MIGVFDSGVGGLSIVNEIRKRQPDADLLYVADRARVPYGNRSLEEVEAISHEIADWLINRGATCLVVACNTASAAALQSLRDAHPHLPIVGMEPAVKPAAETTRTGTVAVYATAATFQGRLFDSVVDRFAPDVHLITEACPQWVDLVESGITSGATAEASVRPVVERARDQSADRIVLGCTHFSFLEPVISRVSGIEVIDPAPAVAAQVERVAPPDNAATGRLTLVCSGSTSDFEYLVSTVARLDPGGITSLT